jgi:hypothetical protein
MRSINRFISAAAIVVASMMTASTFAAPISSLYSTGVSDSGVPLTGGVVDPHWQLISSPDPDYPGPQLTVISNAAPPLSGGYVANTLSSRWIAPRPDGGHNFPRSNCTSGCTDADYAFQTTFDLTGMSLDTVQITGQWAMDDSAVMLLNGLDIGVSRPYVQRLNWSTWAPFELTDGFVAGLNTLTVVVNNHFFPNSQMRDNPVGLHVQLSGTGVLLPEPTSVLLVIASVALFPRPRRSTNFAACRG